MPLFVLTTLEWFDEKMGMMVLYVLPVFDVLLLMHLCTLSSTHATPGSVKGNTLTSSHSVRFLIFPNPFVCIFT